MRRLLRTGRAPRASSAFDEARMLFCRGRALIFDHAYGAARTMLERSIRLDPARGYAYNALGIAYLEQIAANASTFDAAVVAAFTMPFDSRLTGRIRCIIWRWLIVRRGLRCGNPYL